MTITNPYYEFTPLFTPGTKARSDEVNIQYQAVQSAFDFLPGVNDALTTGTATLAPETGSGNAYVVTMPDTRTVNQDGDEIMFFASHANTGATTLNVDTLGAITMVDRSGAAIASGGITIGILYIAHYDAANTRFVLDATLNNVINILDTVQGSGTDDPETPGLFNALLGYENSVGAVLGDIGFNTDIDLSITNKVHGGNIVLAAENVAGALQTLLTIDPDTEQVLLPLSNDAATPTLAFGDGNSGFYESADNVINFVSGGNSQFQYFQGALKSVTTDSWRLQTAAASATVPSICSAGSDQDTGVGWAAADQLSLIAGAKEMLRLVETGTAATDQLIIGPAGLIGGAATPALAFGDGDTGFYESIDDTLNVVLAQTVRFAFSGSSFRGNLADSAEMLNVAATATVPTLIAKKSDLDTGIGSAGLNRLSVIVGGAEAMRFTGVGGGTAVHAHEVNVGLTAHVGSSQGDGPIVSSFNVYSTVAFAGDAATLPDTVELGMIIYIKNDAAVNSMDVFPALGDDAGAGTNTAVAILAGDFAVFIATVADTTWTKLLGGTA